MAIPGPPIEIRFLFVFAPRLRNDLGKRNLYPQVVINLGLRKDRFSVVGVAPGLQLSEASFDTHKALLDVTCRFSVSPVLLIKSREPLYWPQRPHEASVQRPF
jgi:hypothetical protein